MALTASALLLLHPGAQALAASTMASTARSRMGAQWLLRVWPTSIKRPEGSKNERLEQRVARLSLESGRIGVCARDIGKWLDDKQKNFQEFCEEGTDTRGHAKGESTASGVSSKAGYFRHGALGADAEKVVGLPLKVKGNAGAACFEFLCHDAPIFVRKIAFLSTRGGTKLETSVE
ncbi:uncharacterized protein EDB91DRAFT_1079632 [Suillus paluster]|uniref:uncharacterized protein n=1 Tax=Suillus paluster TaxID=48578 RepID=UPI001B85D3B6|nr:uncharacterized protein EDB91DRAFT_1079632 [Suillus paluster]KAG1747954.1 hypothetical protein EDB91DRAFT_1079632 [Suillus paluster]